MKTVESIAKSLNGKKIILRLDLNVPLNREKITDANRIDKIIPTLNFLIKIIKISFFLIFTLIISSTSEYVLIAKHFFVITI